MIASVTTALKPTWTAPSDYDSHFGTPDQLPSKRKKTTINMTQVTPVSPRYIKRGKWFPTTIPRVVRAQANLKPNFTRIAGATSPLSNNPSTKANQKQTTKAGYLPSSGDDYET